jgi:TRAP-type C4-dicarboxylate transport system substrate-binding protein
MFIGCSSGGATGGTYSWKLGGYAPEGAYSYDLIEQFIKDVDQASNGRIKITHYPGNILGDSQTQLNNIAAGTLEMGVQSKSRQNNPKWAVQSSFFMMRDWDAATRVYAEDGVFTKYHKIWANESGWEYLGSVPQGFTQIISTKEFDPAPGPKNIKLRVYPGEAIQAAMTEMGYNCVAMNFSEVHSGLMLGTIDAAWGPSGGEEIQQFADVIKYVYKLNSNFATKSLFMNQDLFDSLSNKDQKMLQEVGMKWQAKCFDGYEDYDKQQWNELAKKINIVELTQEAWNACAEIAQRAERPILLDLVDEKTLNEIQAGMKGN